MEPFDLLHDAARCKVLQAEPQSRLANGPRKVLHEARLVRASKGAYFCRASSILRRLPRCRRVHAWVHAVHCNQ